MTLAFALGALLTAASTSHSGPASAASSESGGTILAASAAIRRSAPSGTARIDELARGGNAFVGRLELDGGAGVPEHADPTEEYIVVLEGSGILTMDGVAHELSPGSAVFMPAGATVSYANGPDAMVAIQVFAGPESADKYATWPVVSQ